MKPPAFDYFAAAGRDEALDMLAQYGPDARLLAGGQSLMAMLNMRLLSPEVVVDISRARDLTGLSIDDDQATLRVEAAVTQAQLARYPGLAGRCPLLARMLPYVGHYQTRARGTVCGSLCHADPSSELPLALAVLDATVELSSGRGVRRLKASEFQTGMLTTAVADDEMMTAVLWPLGPPGMCYAFEEVAMRRGDFAMVAIAVAVDAATVCIGLGGVADTPWVESWPTGTPEELAERCADLAARVPAASDQHASAGYRRELVRRVGIRTIQEAVQSQS